MEISTEQYNKISRFLDAEMTLAEMEAFENELLINTAMLNQLDFEQMLRDGLATLAIKVNEEQQQINRVDGIERAYTNSYKFEATDNYKKCVEETKTDSVKVISKTKWIIIAVAASILVAVITLATYSKHSVEPTIVQSNTTKFLKKKDTTQIALTPQKSDTSKKPNLALVYKNYFVKERLPDVYPMVLADAFSDYENNNYENIQQLNLAGISETRGQYELNSKQNILELGHYYKGISFLETNNAEQSIINFNWIIKNSTDKLLKQKTIWYLALVFIKLNNKEKAITELRKLNNNIKAAEVIKELE